MKRCLWFLLLLAGCVANPPVHNPPPVSVTATQIPTRAHAEWTLIFYFAADNDLEDVELNDLEELTRLPDDPQVHILALVDRSPLGEGNQGYTNRAVVNLANWSHAKLLDVQHDKLTALEDWGRLNMADPQTLRRLVTLAQESYPANHYGLFLVDHGQGWQGICADEGASRPQDALDPQELQTALKSLSAPLDLLALDACLMSSLEVYLAAAPHAHWMVASQDSLPGQGLAYLKALRHLQEKPRSDGQQLGRWFLEAHRTSLDEDEQESVRLQLALLDGRNYGELARSWKELSQALQPLAAREWLALAKARAAAQSFQIEGVGVGGEVEDMGQLLQQIRQRLPELSALTVRVEEQLDRSVVEQVRGRFRQSCSGLSVCFPALAENLSDDYRSLAENLIPEWVEFLKAYTAAERKVKVSSSLSPVRLSGGGGRMDLEARLGRPDEVAATYTVLVRDHRVVGQMTCAVEPGENLLSDYFDGKWLALSEGGDGPRLLAQLDSVEFSQGTALARLSCQLSGADGGAPQPVQLYFPIQPEDLQRPAHLLGVSRGGGLGVTEVRLKAGDQLSFLERDLRPGGHQGRGPGLALSHPQRLQLALAPVPAGDYELGFLVLDLQGRSHWQTRPLLWGK
ncbi:MAG: clostripain-related cysteine peptidase [Vulcanimicrobiota bacterium]